MLMFEPAFVLHCGRRDPVPSTARVGTDVTCVRVSALATARAY